MKKFIVLMIDPEDMDTAAIQTDDVRATVESITDAGYDIIIDTDEDGCATPKGLDEVTQALLNEGKWEGEDGARALVLVHSARLDDTYIS